jgi:hypothetical protein
MKGGGGGRGVGGGNEVEGREGKFQPANYLHTSRRGRVPFGAQKPANLRFRGAYMMAPSNWFKILARVHVLVGGDFSPETDGLVYSFGPFKRTARDALRRLSQEWIFLVLVLFIFKDPIMRSWF